MQLKLIQPDGQPQFGYFDTPLQEANYLDYAWRTAMGYRLPHWRRRLKCNQFQFIGLTSPQLIVGCAIVNLRLVANAFFYVYRPASQTLQEWSWLQPLAIGCQLPTTPDAGCAAFRKGKAHVAITADGRRRDLSVAIGKSLKLEATLSEPQGFQPLRVCSRAGYDGWVYTQKANALPVTGSLEMADERLVLQDLAISGGYDWTIGFMRRHTFWNWASCSATLADGAAFGFNLAAGVNETSYSENALWIDQQQVRLAPIQFDFKREQPMETWHLASSDQRFEATFEPHGLRRERIEAVVLASNFRQVFGTFKGRFSDDQGKIHTFGPCWGFCEDHYARW